MRVHIASVLLAVQTAWDERRVLGGLVLAVAGSGAALAAILWLTEGCK